MAKIVATAAFLVGVTALAFAAPLVPAPELGASALLRAALAASL